MTGISKPLHYEGITGRYYRKVLQNEYCQASHGLCMSTEYLDNNVLIHAVVLNGEGGSHKLDWSPLSSWSAEAGVLWLHDSFHIFNVIWHYID